MTQTISSGRPAADEYAAFYDTYVSKVTETDIVAALEQQIADGRTLFDAIPDDQTNILHDPYTWTIKQVMGHMNDAERVFGYRICRFACRDETPVPGFAENHYVDAMDYDSIELKPLIDEWEHLRRANLAFIKRIAPGAWDVKGSADGNPISVRALAYCLVGHFRHHQLIVKKRVGL